MTRWIGQNWQVLDAVETATGMGVTFGTGLLDEPVEAAGALQTAVAALRNELARPVELTSGGVGVPEVLAEVGLDTTTIMVRAGKETAATAWLRLSELFHPDLIDDEVIPMLWESPSWPADLIHRTGPNAAAVAWLGAMAPDRLERAREVLIHLDPFAGRVPAVYFTNDPSLAGFGYEVDPAVHPGPPVAPTPPRAAFGNARGRLAGSAVDLASALLPRSTAGLVAAGLLRARLEAATQIAGVEAGIVGQVHGIGDSMRVLLLADSPLDAAARDRLLLVFAKSPDLVPDVWIDGAVESGEQPSPSFERGRRAVGLGPDPGLDQTLIRQALAAGGATLHLNLGGPDEATHPGRAASLAGYPWLTPTPGRQRGPSFRTWWVKGDPAIPASHTTRLILGRSVLTGTTRANSATTSLETGRILAVLEDRAGTVAVLDDRLRNIVFHPGLFWRRRALIALLGRRLADVPRLRFDGGVDPETMRRFIRRKRWPALAAWVIAFLALMIFLLL